jgi:hypothetical protein
MITFFDKGILTKSVAHHWFIYDRGICLKNAFNGFGGHFFGQQSIQDLTKLEQSENMESQKIFEVQLAKKNLSIPKCAALISP